jgi:hypothetical protein
MTSDAIRDAIWGAGWVAKKAPELGIALQKMIGWLSFSLQGIDATSLAVLTESLRVLAEIAAAIAGIVDSLAGMTSEKLSAATTAGASLGEGFYNGLLSWHARIISEAEAIAAQTAAALAGGSVTAPAAPYAYAGAAGGGSTQTITNHYSVSVPIGNVQATSPAQAQALAAGVANAVIKKLATAKRSTARGEA